MPMWSKLKREKEFQYGGRLFFHAENSYVSAVIKLLSRWNFGLLIDFALLKRKTSPDPKLEVKLRHNGRHLENR